MNARDRPRDRLGRPLPRGSRDLPAPRRGEPRSTPEALALAVELYDSRRFFEVHELLEWIWRSDETPAADRNFWKALTQVAVGLCHCQRGNARGARALLDRASTGLARYPPVHRGVDTLALIEQARRVASVIERDGTRSVEFPRWPARRRP